MNERPMSPRLAGARPPSLLRYQATVFFIHLTAESRRHRPILAQLELPSVKSAWPRLVGAALWLGPTLAMQIRWRAMRLAGARGVA